MHTVLHPSSECIALSHQVQFQVGVGPGQNGMRAVNITSRHEFVRGHVESIKGQGQVRTEERRVGGRKEGKEGEREGGRKGGKEGEREAGREGGREGRRGKGMQGGRER